MPFYLFHYTYGIEYSREGLPMELQARIYIHIYMYIYICI